jgi:hypothetical protein
VSLLLRGVFPERKVGFSLVLLVFCLPGIFAGGKAERSGSAGRTETVPVSEETALVLPEPGGDAAESAESGPEGGVVPAAAPLSRTVPAQDGTDRSGQVMKALAAAYPDRMGPAEFRNGDWAVQVYGRWFYYAQGRLLPEELRDAVSEYDPQPFYSYRAELPPWEPPSEEQSERMRGMTAQRVQNPAKRSTHFYDALWRASSRAESWDRVKQIYFLGFTVMVHYSIIEELSLVEERILEISKTDAEVARWIRDIKSIDGWNWRNIAATQSRSYHSYGAAIDFLPKTQGSLEVYWQWTARSKSDWWAVPYSGRLHPPENVIKAFESFGFLWGGKWMTYDTIHFEYRPEILLMSGIPQTDLREISYTSSGE